MDAAEKSWKFRAETAEALLEGEREENERLRAYIKELENKLPDEEGADDDDDDDDAVDKLERRAMWDVLWGKEAQISSELADKLMRAMKERVEFSVDDMTDPWDPWNGRGPPRHWRDRQRERNAAEIDVILNQMDGSLQLRMRMPDGRKFGHEISGSQAHRLKGDSRYASELINEITHGFHRSEGGEIPKEVLRGHIGKAIMQLIERR